MLKNIKLFSTNSDRTTYESSASYETPYVSKVTADNSVHYNRPVQIITFKINTIQYQAENGMTWGDWINSEYNINDNFVIYNSGILSSNLSSAVENVTPQDVIVANSIHPLVPVGNTPEK